MGGDGVADGVLATAEAAGDDIRPALVRKLMRGNAVNLHLDAAARGIHEHLADELGASAGGRHRRSLGIGVEAVLLFQHAEVALLQALLHLGQAGEVEQAALVKLPLTVLQHKEEHIGVLAGLGIPQLHVAHIGGGQALLVAAGQGADVAELLQAGRLRLVAEKIVRELSLLGNDEVAHFHLAGLGGGAAPGGFIRTHHADAPGAVHTLHDTTRHLLVGHAEAGLRSGGQRRQRRQQEKTHQKNRSHNCLEPTTGLLFWQENSILRGAL